MISSAAQRRIQRLSIPCVSPGTASTLTVVRYGTPGARPKAYIQASLHADEIPGMLVLNRLVQRLEAGAEAVQGELVLVPVANPLGLAQNVSGRVLGRYALTGAGNYNRLYPDLAEDAASRVQGRLVEDAERNVGTVRGALAEALAAQVPRDETQWLRHTLLSLALDADLALDLHCDEEALLHVYTGTPLWPRARALSAQLGSRATLLAEASGGNPFDEALSSPWWSIARAHPGHPVPPACLSATVELRGLMDVDDDTAAADAENLFRLLQREGVISGDPGPLPEARCEATSLDAVDMARSPVAGVIARMVPVGSRVAAGDVVAELADPLDVEHASGRTQVRSATDGLVFARTDQRIARPGDVLVKVAGERALAHRAAGALLTD